MRYKGIRRLKLLVYNIIGWTLAILFLLVIRGVGTTEDGALDVTFVDGVKMLLFLGPAFGLMVGLLKLFVEVKLYKKVSLLKLLIINTLSFVAFYFILILMGYGIAIFLFDLKIGFKEFSADRASAAIFIYFLIVDAALSGVRQLQFLFGEHTFKRLLTGKFYNPREEDRIFMFMDLQSSTSLAEKIGHAEYSRFIQDCFNDLSVVMEFEAEIYQYVGDEVVLTWDMRSGLKDQNCIKAYFRFKEKLEDRSAHYLKKYGSTPFFKAGMHGGKVMAAEVGKYKREIAYHGDTINTASRIQNMCNQFDSELLISDYLRQKLTIDIYEFNFLGTIQLKGKENEVSVYSVENLG